jgi:hypothetical protein
MIRQSEASAPGLLAAVALAVAGCTGPVADQPVPVNLSYSGDRLCRAEVEGQRFVSDGDFEAMEAVFAQFKARGGRAILNLAPEAPWRCAGGVVATAQRTGLEIGLASEASEAK